MKILRMLHSLSRLFDPAEVRKTRRLKTQWDELDDVATIIQDKKKVGIIQKKEGIEPEILRDEMNMLLERVASDTKRIREIIDQLLTN